jgi:non-ribosomal peptide synthetase component E (peptide arylation enzyme)
VGRELATQEVQIVDAAGNVLGERQVGEIVVRGPSVMKGYFNRAGKLQKCCGRAGCTPAILAISQTDKLYVTGRIKDLIIRHGKKLLSTGH